MKLPEWITGRSGVVAIETAARLPNGHAPRLARPDALQQDAAVNEALVIERAPLLVHRRAVEIEFDDVIFLDHFWGDRDGEEKNVADCPDAAR